MAIDREKFYKLYRQYVYESLTELIQAQAENSFGNGGKAWKYISGLVTKGVRSYVYAVYKPRVYQRRSKAGGLGDPNNVVIDVGQCVINDEGGEIPLRLTNTTPPGLGDDGGYIADDVIAGTGYRFAKYDREHRYAVPRDFYTTLDEQYDSDKAGNIILQSIRGKLQNLVNQAFERAWAASSK